MRNKKIASKNALILIVLSAVVLVSGCTQPTGVATGPGVAILEFKPDLANVFSDERIDLRAKIENQGQAKARNAVAELTNIDLSEWGGIGIISFQNLGDLLPADKTTNTPGETKQVAWTNLRAPTLSKNIVFTYEPTVRISYDYKTSATKPITLVDQDELVKIKQRGGTLTSKPTQYTAGPLSVEIRTGNYVTTSTQLGNTYDIFPIFIKITNTIWESGGSVVPEALTFGQERYPVKVRIEPPTGTTFVFSGYQGSQDCGTYVDVDLWRGKDAEITCELQVVSPPTVKTEGLIMVDLDYRFQRDASTQVTVTGTQEPGGLF